MTGEGTILHKILLVEDDVHIMEFVTLALNEAGYNVECAVNGSEGLVCVEGDCPDIIVTDINMPVMDGLEMCQNIQDRLRAGSPPIMLMTALTKIKGGECCNYIDILRKPFALDLLLQKVGLVFAQADS